MNINRWRSLSEIFISPNRVKCIVVGPLVSGTNMVIGVQCFGKLNSFFWLRLEGKDRSRKLWNRIFSKVSENLQHRRNLKLLEVVSI
jgi:hypothetical protein